MKPDSLAEWNRKRRESGEKLLAWCHHALRDIHWVSERVRLRAIAEYSADIATEHAASLKERLG